MPRTAAQRRADAYAKVHVYAAKALKAEGGPDIVTDVVIDDETLERETKRLLGESVDAPDPTRDDFACQTLRRSVGAYPVNIRFRPRSMVALLATITTRRRSPSSACATVVRGVRVGHHWPGYTVTRKPDGTLEITRPDGTTPT